MTGAGPPKCKTCGTAEWQHLCRGKIAYVDLGARNIQVVEATPRQIAMIEHKRKGKDYVQAIPSPLAKEATDVPEASVATLGESSLQEKATVRNHPGTDLDILVGKKRGRPKKIGDKKEYWREKAAERRAKKDGKVS